MSTPAGSRTGQAAWRRTRQRIINTREHECNWCHKQLSKTAKPGTHNAIEVDHLIAVLEGGTDHEDNLTISCPRCNRSKGDRNAPSFGSTDRHGSRIEDTRIICIVHGSHDEGGLLSTCPHSGSLNHLDDRRRVKAG